MVGSPSSHCRRTSTWSSGCSARRDVAGAERHTRLTGIPGAKNGEASVCPLPGRLPGLQSRRHPRGRSWKYVELVSGEKELYNLERDAFELTNVAGNASNAGLIAIM